jgi:hypothetical protein
LSFVGSNVTVGQKSASDTVRRLKKTRKAARMREFMATSRRLRSGRVLDIGYYMQKLPLITTFGEKFKAEISASGIHARRLGCYWL